MSIQNSENSENLDSSVNELYNSQFNPVNSKKSGFYYAFEPAINATKWIKNYFSNKTSDNYKNGNLKKKTEDGNEEVSIKEDVLNNLPKIESRNEYLDTVVQDTLRYGQQDNRVSRLVNPMINKDYKSLQIMAYVMLEKFIGVDGAKNLVTIKNKNRTAYQSKIKDVFNETLRPKIEDCYSLVA